MAYNRTIGNIKLSVYDKENHGPPHAHILCEKGKKGRIVIETLELYNKDTLPPPCLKTIKEWMETRQDELLEAWKTARARQWQEGNKR